MRLDRRTILLSFLLVHSVLLSAQQPPDTIQVLFYGNSYTFYNNMPGMFEKLVTSNFPRHEVHIKNFTFNGATLESIYNHPDFKMTLNEQKWDYVVLQEQSRRPITDFDLMRKYAGKLNRIITESGAETIFFMTWGRKSNPGMIKQLAESYKDVTKNNRAMLAPVGLIWHNLINMYPKIELYDSDGSHPNIYGSYLCLVTIYQTIFGAGEKFKGLKIEEAEEELMTSIENEVMKFFIKKQSQAN